MTITQILMEVVMNLNNLLDVVKTHFKGNEEELLDQLIELMDESEAIVLLESIAGLVGIDIDDDLSFDDIDEE